MTTTQARDSILDNAGELTTDFIRELKNVAADSNEIRKQDPEAYVKCPRCYGHHSIHGNFDNLCDPCQITLVQHFPDHESIPFIKAAQARWKKV